MTRYAVYASSAILLFALGFYGLIVARHLIRKIIALNVALSGVFMLLVSLGVRSAHTLSDPVPQAMVLTGIVVAFGATAFALSLAASIHRATGSVVLDQGEPPDG
jgi:multicomponent Na+:H+ antiporter subunit C